MIEKLYEKAQRAYEAHDFRVAFESLQEIIRVVGLRVDLRIKEAECLYYLSRAPEAIAIVEALKKDNPSVPDFNAILSLYYRAMGNFEKSAALLESLPSTVPGHAFLTGWHLLREGRFLEGMTRREPELSLKRVEQLYPFSLTKRLRDPRQLKRGLNVLLALEGGNGDEIAYGRFAQTLARTGARVLVGASPGLVPAVRRMWGVSLAGPLESVAPDAYDLYVPSMSLISLFGIQNPSDQIVFPYLFPSQDEVRLVEKEIAPLIHGKKIGIQWRGNPEFDYSEFKTFPADLLVQFKELGSLFSLQVQRDVGENILPSEAHAYDLQAGEISWERTIAAVSQMDYVISGDTTIAHIAGALGKPAALLVPHAPHPYWADLKEISTWYPSVRVFRQPRYNDWAGAADAAFNWIRDAR